MRAKPILVISCSLNPDSRSRRLAEAAVEAIRRAGEPVDFIRLQDHELPLCDGGASFGAPAVKLLRDRIAAASAILLAAPVYNYSLNAAAKNLIELTGSAWQDKPVGLLCAAGGRSSYMSPVGLANNLMFDFRCWIIPRFVYASANDLDGSDELPAGIQERVTQLAHQAIDIGRALDWSRARRAGIERADRAAGEAPIHIAAESAVTDASPGGTDGAVADHAAVRLADAAVNTSGRSTAAAPEPAEELECR